MKLNLIFSLFFYLVLLMNDCSHKASKRDIIGYYKNKEYNKIQSFILLNSGKTYPLYISLKLKEDSTFVYETCGSIVWGIWKVKDDTLLLFCHRFRYRNDSLNYVRDTTCRRKDIPYRKFYIHPNGELRSSFYVKQFKLTGLEYLVKVKDKEK